MTFQSIEYLIFLPIVFFLYWTIGKKSKTLQNLTIVIASLIFYGWWDWRFLGLLLFTAISTFMTGRWIWNTEEQRKRRILFVGVLVLNLAVLFFFKYYNFFLEAFTDVLSLLGIHAGISTLKILLPVGISFYTFTALSYSIDVYQSKIEPTDDFLAYLAYVMFFPSILSGPISRARTQLPQYMGHREFSYEKAVSACKFILWGGLMKLCLADRLGIYVDAVYGNINQHNGTTLFLASLMYSIQIYADFAGYSLMAIGSGKLLGIELPTNFVRPYFALTITDFWRRWHISLTTWFRDYIYFPLGGSRCSKHRWIINTMIVFTVSGLWHGAAYTFLIWGALHGICMVVERLLYGDKIKSISDKLSFANVLRWLLTFSILNFTWIFFRVDGIGNVFTVLNKIFTEPGQLFLDPDTMFYALFFFVIVFANDYMEERHSLKIKLLNNKSSIVRWATCLALASMILLFGVLDGGSFIYFQF